MHRKIAMGVGAIIASVIVLVIGLIMVYGSPQDHITVASFAGSIFVALTPVGILMGVMSFFDNDQKGESK